MNYSYITNKIPKQNKKFRPPLPNLTPKPNILIQSKQINLLPVPKNISTSLDKQSIPHTDQNHNFYTYLRKEAMYSNKRNSSYNQYQKSQEKNKSRVSTSYSQKSLKNIDNKNTQGSLKPKTPEALLKQKITSKSWILYDNQLKRIILQKGCHVKRQAASLTKIMTCIVAIQFCERWAINIKQLKIKITKRILIVDGTTAELQIGHILSLENLLYGMMLPSGNDAAITIAQYIGTLITIVKQGFSKQIIYDPQKLAEQVANSRYCIKNFLVEMNGKGLDIGMLRSHYGNSHGLSQKNNYSTCQDLVRLCQYALKNRRFLQIVSCKLYKAKCLATQKQYVWENTHKLLDQGWYGIKTGVTPAAGPCLSSFFKGYKNNRYLNIIIILLNCNSMQERYQQTKLLFDYAINKRYY